MTNNPVIEQLESVIAKIAWVQGILNAVQNHTTDFQTADLISGVNFITESVLEDAEQLFLLLGRK